MSRLFSRLENIGQDQNEGAPPAESARQADAHADAAFPAGFGDTPITGATLPNPAGMPPPVPGYSIPSSLARSPLPPAAVIARPAWTVRLWLASLLLLIGLSLLLLALPERLLPTAPRQRPAGAAPEVSAAPRPAAGAARQVPAPAPTAVATVNPPVPAAARAPRAEPRSPAPAAAPAPPAPSRSSGSAACSEAMLAMNLCSKSSP